MLSSNISFFDKSTTFLRARVLKNIKIEKRIQIIISKVEFAYIHYLIVRQIEERLETMRLQYTYFLFENYFFRYNN